ncbi:MAG: hypothetical protein ACFFDB_00035 [Promethearchaeota archaeon]
MDSRYFKVFIIISIYLILDGFISILLLYSQPFEYQLIRYFRIGIGVIIGIGTIKKKDKDLGSWYIIFIIIAGYIFADGLYSVLIQLDQPIEYQISRLFRAFVGLFFGILVIKSEMKRKLKRSDLRFLAIIISLITILIGAGLTGYFLDIPNQRISLNILYIANLILIFGNVISISIFYFATKEKTEKREKSEWVKERKKEKKS